MIRTVDILEILLFISSNIKLKISDKKTIRLISHMYLGFILGPTCVGNNPPSVGSSLK